MRKFPVLIFLLLITPTTQLAFAGKLDKSALEKLVNNKTWHINWAACMGGANGCKTYWNWSKDGSVCARAIDAKRTDKCADDGKWRIEEDKLCWKLTWLGGSEGYKSVCIDIEETSKGHYQTKRVGGIGITFFEFDVIN